MVGLVGGGDPTGESLVEVHGFYYNIVDYYTTIPPYYHTTILLVVVCGPWCLVWHLGYARLHVHLHYYALLCYYTILLNYTTILKYTQVFYTIYDTRRYETRL